ncbi:DEAD/DEAH box helicase [Amantichitinum ursilacus]|uniref:ATP-dependent RNA helicase RhlE n=1 Tax=Amantichitinum ursilacus TaxID=857265 RepID=A0A0N0XGX0_9NEIS|nr:DEAD/DEAH box helicase [Amantichitinum ursilacus]KPC50502.1 ATP-dependent RNA helicase RhlE [Amantichitinum ursilacus]
MTLAAHDQASDQDITFSSLGLDEDLSKELASQGLVNPTPIQAHAIPVLLRGEDLMASAQTGTGKTAAFLLPAITRLARPPVHHGKGPRVLVLTPTRELAEQVSKVAVAFARRIPRCKVVSVVGGVPYPVQHKQLAQPVEVLVATPGRLMDLMRSGRIDFRRLEMLVLDEADRMLDMGFIDDIEEIVGQLPPERQTALFSATLSQTVQTFAAPMLRNPQKVELAPQGLPTANVEQSVHYADGYEHKLKLTAALAQALPDTQSIVFVATKVDADSISDWLKLEGLRADAMHGDLPQRTRRKVLDKLRRGEIDMLIATDVAARGIDVAGIGQVINFDLPRFSEDYIHRIGRTGRAGRSGRAVSLVTKNDFMLLTRIRKRYQIDFGTMAMEGLEARFQPAARGERGGDRGNDRGGRGFGGGGRPQGGNGGRGGYAGKPREGGYNRDSAPREGGYNRDSAPREGGFNRADDNGERTFSRAPREGGYNREGGFNRDSAPREGGFKREGGFNRDSAPREGGFKREGGFNRDSAPREGGFKREGGFSRDAAAPREGGFKREGGFNSAPREGGFKREGARDGAPRSDRAIRGEFARRNNRGE